MHVLLVDDDTSFRRSLAIGLESAGVRVLEAKSGMEALEILYSHQTRLDQVKSVVVDARMPGLDGFWLTDQINVLYPDLKVIILSAHSYPYLLDRYTLMEKPVNINHLKEMLSK